MLEFVVVVLGWMELGGEKRKIKYIHACVDGRDWHRPRLLLPGGCLP